MSLGILLDTPFYDRAYYNETFLHPMAALTVGCLGILTLSLSRRFALVPFVALTCFISVCNTTFAVIDAVGRNSFRARLKGYPYRKFRTLC